jgi:hypothetical protein
MSDLHGIASRYHDEKQKEIQRAVDAERERIFAALLSDEVVLEAADTFLGNNSVVTIHEVVDRTREAITAAIPHLKGE